MGNNSSFSKSNDGDENLLRRNARHMFRGSSDEESGRIEHSKSARYNRKKNSSNLTKWDPNDTRLLALSRRQQYEKGPTVAERPCISGMTRHHKMILQKIWMRALDSDKQECARNILSHLLRSNTQLYQIFNLTGMTDKEIVCSSRFAHLAANFALVFDFVITNLDDLKRVAFALEQLGAHHANFGFPIGQTYWSLFTRVFEDNPLKLMFQNPEGHTVWKLMINFIIRQMHNGYVSELEKPTKKVSNTLHVDRAEFY
ncbi:Globin domain containing protein [Aphelenchoides bicaudatus]|nr:Globin domain containing protein [Aphelenchoides bicaudatus]